MHTLRSSSLLALSLALGLGALAPAQADEMLKLRLTLHSGSLSKTTKMTNSGLKEARDALRQWYSHSYENLGTWTLLDKLDEPGVRGKLAKAAALSGRDTYHLDIDLEDSHIVDEDGDKGVWPHAGTRNGEKRVYMGETWIANQYWGRVYITLLHEFGHLADTSECDSNGYGKDGHTLSEVIAPAGAFKEGFAHYISFRDLDDAKVKALGARSVTSRWNRIMRFDKGDKLMAENEDGEHVRVQARHLNLWDYVSNEAFVAGVLMDLRKMTSHDGRTIGDHLIEAAFQSTQHKPCRHLGTLLHACIVGGARYIPDLEQHIREIVDIRSFQTAPAADIEMLLEGKLPAWMKADEAPYGRNYYPTEDGTEDIPPVNGLQAVDADPTGVFGF